MVCLFKAERTRSKKVGKMLEILMLRGPRVPQHLYRAFVETDNPHCADKIAPYLIQLEKQALGKDPSGKPFKSKIKTWSSKAMHLLYPMQTSCRGYNVFDASVSQSVSQSVLFFLSAQLLLTAQQNFLKL